MIACDKQSPPSTPIVNPPSGVETINGTERLGWNQPAADAVELATIGYVVYVDGARTALVGAACAPAPAASVFACTARSATPGAHTLELAAFVTDGSVPSPRRRAARHAGGAVPGCEGRDCPADLAQPERTSRRNRGGRPRLAHRCRVAPDGPSLSPSRARSRGPPPSASAMQASLIASPRSLADTVGAGVNSRRSRSIRHSSGRTICSRSTAPHAIGRDHVHPRRFREVSTRSGIAQSCSTAWPPRRRSQRPH